MKNCIVMIGLGLSIAFGAQAQRCPNPGSDSTPASRYQLNPNGTALDKKTGLTWRRCAEGQVFQGNSCKGKPQKFSVPNANAWAIKLNAGPAVARQGFNNWRLPTQDELLSLVSTGCTAPAINLKVFPTTPAATFWASTPGSGGGSVWSVDFNDGFDGLFGQNSELFVRFVRK